MSLTRAERILRWIRTEPGDLDVAPEQPSTDELVERAAKHLACQRPDCTADALAPLAIISCDGPRWVDLCLDCSRLLAYEIGETCARSGCSRSAPPDRSRGGWCPSCCGRLHSVIVRADGLRTELLAALVPTSAQATGAPVSGSREAPVPLRLGLMSTAETMTSAYALAEDLLREQLRAKPAQRTRPDRWGVPHPVPADERWARSVAFLAGGWLQLLDTEAGRSVAAHLVALGAAANRALGRDRLVHRLEAPCPSCNSLTLRRHDGDDRVVCEMCGRTETEETYAWLSRAAVDAYDDGSADGRVRSSVGWSDEPARMRAFGTGGAA